MTVKRCRCYVSLTVCVMKQVLSKWQSLFQQDLHLTWGQTVTAPTKYLFYCRAWSLWWWEDTVFSKRRGPWETRLGFDRTLVKVEARPGLSLGASISPAHCPTEPACAASLWKEPEINTKGTHPLSSPQSAPDTQEYSSMEWCVLLVRAGCVISHCCAELPGIVCRPLPL